MPPCLMATQTAGKRQQKNDSKRQPKHSIALAKLTLLPPRHFSSRHVIVSSRNVLSLLADRVGVVTHDLFTEPHYI
jgi:hypothetical protein